MNDSPKIQLSPFEEQLLTDSSWLLTKNAVLEKIKALLASLQDGQNEILNGVKQFLPVEVLQPSPKISRGENYRGLPWMVLDYPRYFDRDNLFVIRTMFWWGNFFSTTLLMSGVHKARFSERIAGKWELLKNSEFYISASETPWDHHFESSNYTLLRGLTEDEFSAHLSTHPFLKLAKKRPLEELAIMDQKLISDFSLIASLFTG